MPSAYITGKNVGFTELEAMLIKNLSPFRDDDIYLTVKMALAPGAYSRISFSAGSWSAHFMAIVGVDGLPLSAVGFVNGPPRWSAILNGSSAATPESTPAVEEEKWYTVEARYDSATITAAKLQCIDGWSYSSGSQLSSTSARAIRIGNMHAVLDNAMYPVYVDEVRLGTTRWGSEIFSDDFESADFSAWDFATPWDAIAGYGCEIVDTPDFPFYSPGCNPFFAGREGVYLAPVTIPYGNVPVGQVG